MIWSSMAEKSVLKRCSRSIAALWNSQAAALIPETLPNPLASGDRVHTGPCCSTPAKRACRMHWCLRTRNACLSSACGLSIVFVAWRADAHKPVAAAAAISNLHLCCCLHSTAAPSPCRPPITRYLMPFRPRSSPVESSASYRFADAAWWHGLK